MTPPTLAVADILRAQGDRFLERYRSSFGFQQLKAFRAILRCRTAALGGHRDACLCCGHQAISYNSCRNRHCPKCQTQARERWLAARERELLHVLPKAFVRIRHFGFLANRFRASRVDLCRRLLSNFSGTPGAPDTLVLDCHDCIWHCPNCGATMIVLERFTAEE